jgi:hypothetical protein
MAWEAALIVPAAAVAGIIARKFADLIAKRTGHSRRKAEEALATAGFSLIIGPDNDDNPAPRAPRVAART